MANQESAPDVWLSVGGLYVKTGHSNSHAEVETDTEIDIVPSFLSLAELINHWHVVPQSQLNGQWNHHVPMTTINIKVNITVSPFWTRDIKESCSVSSNKIFSMGVIGVTLWK